MTSAVDLPRGGDLRRASDARLAALVGHGDQQAFAALYERHRSLVNAIARASSRERAEDIAQEAWTSAYRALAAADKPIEHVAPWLAAIARNVARDRARQHQRQPEIANEDLLEMAPAAGGVESALEGKQDIARLLGAYDELPEDQQVIVNLREFGGMTYKEIAEHLGKPVSTIEAALFRARRKMAKEYADLQTGRRCGVVQAQLMSGHQLPRLERHRLTRHLGRCASCERVARAEGAAELVPAPRLARIAGAIPLPAFLARLVRGGAGEVIGPLASKAAVAGVAVAVAAGALVMTTGGGPGAAPLAQPSGSGGATTAAVAQESALVAAPNVVRATKVSLPASSRGSSATIPLSTTNPSAAPPVAPVAPAPAQRTGGSRQRRAASVPRRRQASRAPAAAPAPAATPSPAATPAPAAAAPAPAAAAPAPAAAAPAAAAPAAAAPARAVTPAARPVAPAPAPAPVQRPAAQAPAARSGPSVTQTPTCITADCSIGG